MIKRSLAELQAIYPRTRAARIFLGLCYECGGEKEPENETTRCRKCKTAENARERKRRRGKPRPAKWATTELRRQRRALGQCIECKKPAGKFAKCWDCRMKGVAKNARWRGSKRGQATKRRWYVVTKLREGRPVVLRRGEHKLLREVKAAENRPEHTIVQVRTRYGSRAAVLLLPAAA